MDRFQRIRWALLLVALALTLVTSVYPTSEEEKLAETPPSKRTQLASQRTSSSEEDYVMPSAELKGEINPFTPRRWEKSLPLPEQPAKSEVAIKPEPSTPPGPPALPFKFMGRMDESGQETIYLSRGDEMIIARTGETLDNTYKIQFMDSQHIEFEHIPTGEKQVLSISAAEK